MTDKGNMIIIDIGSHSIKSGFSPDPAPCSVFPSIVGYPRNAELKDYLSLRESYVGDEAQCKRGVLSFKYPVEDGCVTNWEDMEQIFDYIFNEELRVDTTNHPIFSPEHLLNPKLNRRILTEIMFEKYNIPAIYFYDKPTLCLFMNGITTGTVFHSGDAMTYSLPIYEGYPLREDFHCMHLGGRDVTDYMMKLLTDRGYCFSTDADRELVRDMKEKFSFVPLDSKQDSHSGQIVENKHQLPDGQVVTFDKELVSCPQAMFKPSLIGSQSHGIHNLVYASIMNAEFDCRREFYSNIVLTGGNTYYPGFIERLQKEVSSQAIRTFKVGIISPGLRKYSSWIGASLLSSVSDTSLGANYVTIQEYKDTGIQCLERIQPF